ncbi:MAG: 2-amino-4-hydroxy-6-hydroxymethyldihydropteridine diphosphokinase, partial [Pseudomonadota bacterium]|nr:2-amino-4-hydroxy-6-hydroxymethyldihydropteridine diphosphokinase [Pseudomonadota bacterium]
MAAIDAFMTLEELSGVYETEPKYVLNQPPFLNMAIAGNCEMKPEKLLASLKEAEVKIGRVPAAERYGPRAIDLDILFFGDQVVDQHDLQIPHPLIAEREFVLKTQADIAPQFRH